MSAARAQMMARRRRSLAILGAAARLSFVLRAGHGRRGVAAAALFVAGLGGYVLFLRNQALRDRERREPRQLRAIHAAPAATTRRKVIEPLRAAPESVVRIDDDDIELHNIDTIDLTGLYEDDEAPARTRTTQGVLTRLRTWSERRRPLLALARSRMSGS